jgi:hypothetical protein
MRRSLIILAAVLVPFVGCKIEPKPPTEADAKQVWHNVNKQFGLTSQIELVDLKKTDGQMSEVNGTQIYTFFYELRKKHLTKMGHWKPGDIETLHSNYGFTKTENGWQGPDGTHFTD